MKCVLAGYDVHETRRLARTAHFLWSLSRILIQVDMAYQFPPYFAFPPFFTLQPAQATRQKQLELWQNFVLGWAHHHNQSLISVTEWPHFGNPDIKRRLSVEGIGSVVEHLINAGYAEWEDDSHARIRVMWRRPVDWAAIIYDYACDNAMVGNVYTVYELHSGDDTTDAQFYRLEAWLMLRALQTLEEEGKAQIFTASSDDDAGVKFFPRT